MNFREYSSVIRKLNSIQNAVRNNFTENPQDIFQESPFTTNIQNYIVVALSFPYFLMKFYSWTKKQKHLRSNLLLCISRD